MSDDDAEVYWRHLSVRRRMDDSEAGIKIILIRSCCWFTRNYGVHDYKQMLIDVVASECNMDIIVRAYIKRDKMD